MLVACDLALLIQYSCNSNSSSSSCSNSYSNLVYTYKNYLTFGIVLKYN